MIAPIAYLALQEQIVLPVNSNEAITINNLIKASNIVVQIQLMATGLLTERLLDELDHRFAEWTPSRFQAATGWWLYL